MKKANRKSSKRAPKRVKEIVCQQPEPLQAESSVKEAGERMRLLHTNRLPVVSDHHLVGALEGEHPERTAGGMGHDPETTLVREFMVKKVYYCFENQSLEEAGEIMREHHLEYLPVVDNDMRVIGILARRDLAAKQTRASK